MKDYQQGTLNENKHINIMNVCTASIAFIVLGFECWYVIDLIWSSDDEKVEHEIYIRGLVIKAVIFLLLGVGFLIFGALSICSLKKHFNDFYSSYLPLLIASILLLTIPTMLRGLILLLRVVSDDFEAFVLKHMYEFNTTIVILSNTALFS